MAAVLSVGPRSTDNTQNQESVLQHFYFFAVIAIVFSLIILRVILLRRRNQALSSFFRLGGSASSSYGSYPPHNSTTGAMYHGIQLSSIPAAYLPDRRIRAADTDAHGRRLGPAGEELDGKDALPAYDNFDRPPKYIEAGWSHGGPPQPTEQSAATSSQGEQSGTAHPNSTSGDRQFDDTHAMAGVAHGSDAPLPSPALNDLSSS
ncbi:hypothetical protein OG21DRAFT_1497291 [Imleria badia]|nr:hypothetical protein OG21DRAFT_1497291 [Imleria badia]